MTDVATRSPLRILSMSAAQSQTRRRSARTVDNEEDARPTKKQKIEESTRGSERQVNGKKATTMASGKNKSSYDEDNAGFTFTRRAKKPPTKPSVAETSHEKDDKTQIKPPPKTREPGKRRSARLSGEKPNDISEQQQTKQHTKDISNDRGRSRTRTEDKSPEVPDAAKNDTLRVEKKRRTTKIALPFADTPVMARNKEMRKSSAENRRRSSSTLRGRRASSLMDSGVSNAVPHSEVKTTEFFKHISQDLPEPRRMRQLLTWCGARALSERPSASSSDTSAILAARAIQEELLKDFNDKSEMSDWFNRDDIPTTVLVKQPNPRNIENASKLQELEIEVKRLEQEKSNWTSLLGTITSSIKDEATRSGEMEKPPLIQTINNSLLADSDQKTYAKQLSEQDQTAHIVRSRLKDTTDSLEFKIDSLASSVHRIRNLDTLLNETVDDVLSHAAKNLEQRNEDRLEEAGSEKIGIRDLLKSFSRAGT